MRRRRDFVPFAILTLVAGILALLAWLTRDPENPFFVRAERAPVIGDVVAALRARYLSEDPREAAHRRFVEARRRERDARRAAREQIVIGIGATLRDAPHAGAEVVERTRRLESYTVLERQNGWVRIQTGPEVAWYDPTEPRDTTPPLGNEPEPPRPLPARPADAALLAAAREHLGEPLAERAVAGYALLTDVADRDVLDEILAPLAGIEATYRQRYGVAPIGEPAETIVLFASAASYERFRDQVPDLEETQSRGHTLRGLVALFAGPRRDETAATLLHEVGHLLNRRALGPALPPWLDEGIASDFAAAAWAAHRRVGYTEGWREREPLRLTLRGPLASLHSVAEQLARGEPLELETLFALDRRAFYSVSVGRRAYDLSGLLVRFLSESPHAAAWQRFLVRVSSGGPPSTAALLAHLEISLPSLEQELSSWIEQEAARAGLSVQTPE